MSCVSLYILYLDKDDKDNLNNLNLLFIQYFCPRQGTRRLNFTASRRVAVHSDISVITAGQTRLISVELFHTAEITRRKLVTLRALVAFTDVDETKLP